jgi:wyosine [tRNA(Phe)-imidazoG37] synthetase (radical SAM superfamily)
MNVIFYGAGADAKRNFRKYKTEGLNPVCFVDRDENKHGTYFPEGNSDSVIVLPLRKAIKMYPDYVLYLTVGTLSVSDVTEYLRSEGIPNARIKTPYEFFEGFYCNDLFNYITIGPDFTQPCCYSGKRKRTKCFSFEEAITYKKKFISEILSDMEKGLPTICDGCPNQKFGLHNEIIDNVLISQGYNNDFCNFKCSYCSFHQEKPYKNDNELIKTIESISKNLPFAVIHLANLEFLANKNCGDILKFMTEHNIYSALTTNGSLFPEELNNYIKKGLLTTVNCSLDAGTRETYKIIKGVDCFEKTCKNLEIYRDLGVPLLLKYIILDGVNDNKKDIDGFIDLAVRLNSKIVYLSADIHGTSKNLSENAINMTEYFVRLCDEKSLKFEIVTGNFNKSDLKLILGEVENEQIRISVPL